MGGKFNKLVSCLPKDPQAGSETGLLGKAVWMLEGVATDMLGIVPLPSEVWKKS